MRGQQDGTGAKVRNNSIKLLLEVMLKVLGQHGVRDGASEQDSWAFKTPQCREWVDVHLWTKLEAKLSWKHPWRAEFDLIGLGDILEYAANALDPTIVIAQKQLRISNASLNRALWALMGRWS